MEKQPIDKQTYEKYKTFAIQRRTLLSKVNLYFMCAFVVMFMVALIISFITQLYWGFIGLAVIFVAFVITNAVMWAPISKIQPDIDDYEEAHPLTPHKSYIPQAVAKPELELKQNQKLEPEPAPTPDPESLMRTKYKNLIEVCGIRFLIKYYPQAKRLPIRDITVTEDYPYSEKTERLSAVKELIRSDLCEYTFRNILIEYGDLLDAQELDKIKEYLTEWEVEEKVSSVAAPAPRCADIPDEQINNDEEDEEANEEYVTEDEYDSGESEETIECDDEAVENDCNEVEEAVEYDEEDEENEEDREDLKLCPICEKNYIDKNSAMCPDCRKLLVGVQESRKYIPAENYGRGNTVKMSSTGSKFGEWFTFVNEHATNRFKHGFKAYNSKGDYVGIVFMTDDKRSPAYGCIELSMFTNYYRRYGEWHRIKSNGGYVSWQLLCARLEKYGKYECFID